MRVRLAGLTAGVLAAAAAYGQYVISAHSGVIQVVEGSAYLNDKAIETKFGQFPDIKAGQEFRTEQGRAEVLLTPGVFLRMGEDSSIKMVSNALTDTRVEVLGGSVIVECDEIPKDNSIELLYKNNTMMLVKHGLYRINTEPGVFQVYDGEAIVKGESGQLTLRAGKETSLTGVLMAENFDKKATDDLYSWSSRRAGYLATANASSAMSLKNSGGYSSSLFGFGGWQFNPMFGMFTYVPYSGFGYSPFGYGWWSPGTIGYFMPFYGGYYGGGYSGGYAAGRVPARVATGNTGRGFGNAGAGARSSAGFGGFPSGGFSGGGVAAGGGAMSGGAMSGGGMSGGGMAGGGGHAGGAGGGHR